MKIHFIILALLLAAFVGYSQKRFTLKSYVGNQLVKINGRQYTITKEGVKIKTNFPRFDTLYLKSESSDYKYPIICNFKPDSVYCISVGCCGSLHILKKSKFNSDSLKKWDPELDSEKITNQLRDKSFISIGTVYETKDSIYAWHLDPACMSEHKAIGKELWRLGVPPKGFYWNNITSIFFFKQDSTLPKHELTSVEEFVGINNIKELASISFLLFDDQKFVILYDEKKNKVLLKYE